jgi:hypothetical protein
MIVTGTRIFAFVACWLVWNSAASAIDAPAPPAEGNSISAKEMEESAAPAKFVALDLWVVTLRMPKDVVQEDQLGPLLARVENLPTVIGDRDDARKLLDRLKDQGAVRRLQTFRMSTLSGHKGQILRGDRLPMITGMTTTTFGQTNNIQFQEAGTSVQLTPTVVNVDEIRVELNYERSDVVNSADVVLARPNEGEPTPAQDVTSQTFTTTSTLKSGEAALVALLSDTDEGEYNPAHSFGFNCRSWSSGIVAANCHCETRCGPTTDVCWHECCGIGSRDRADLRRREQDRGRGDNNDESQQILLELAP